MPGRKVVKLDHGRIARLERRLDTAERRVREMNAQLDQVTEVLTRLVRVVAVQSRDARKTVERIDERVKRLGRAIATGRTADLRRVNGLERRLGVVERRTS
jgi:response regulator RpfG family c-di-GMP phosphodiesterase